MSTTLNPCPSCGKEVRMVSCQSGGSRRIKIGCFHGCRISLASPLRESTDFLRSYPEIKDGLVAGWNVFSPSAEITQAVRDSKS